MYKFFYEFSKEILNNKLILSDKEITNHISKSLRLKINDEVIICDEKENQAVFTITNINKNQVILKFNKNIKTNSEPSVNLHIYMCYPKTDKFEFCIQKLTELGVNEITPVISKNCVSTPTEKDFVKKLERFKKIAKSASMQSKRNKFIKIHNLINFNTCLNEIQNYDNKFILYENSKNKIKKQTFENKDNIAVIIGSEGGFCDDEIKKAQEHNVIELSLGERILRCETAPIVISSIIMYETNNF